jgi:hypothetical protein
MLNRYLIFAFIDFKSGIIDMPGWESCIVNEQKNQQMTGSILHYVMAFKF